jgi:mannose-6-phosphate isomerase-like protein (cupin superfamily)
LTDAQITILDGSGGPELPIIDGAGEARAIVWPGMGARTRSLHRIRLGEDAATVELSHPSDAVYYVADGTGSVEDLGLGERQDLVLGAMFHIDAGTRYVIHAGDTGLQVIGGPSPADDSLYEHLTPTGG